MYSGFRNNASWLRPEAASAVLFALLVVLFAVLSHPSHPASRWVWPSESIAASSPPPVDSPSNADAPADVVQVGAIAVDPRQRAIADYLSRRFQVAAGPTAVVVRDAYEAAADTGVDPLLILAVIAIESRFHPYAESAAGAKGLMQIIPKYHLDKLAPLGGEPAVLDPAVNIQVGARILEEYVRRAGNVRDGLQMYNGALGDETYAYANKVLREKQRLHQLVAANERPDARRAAG